MTDPTTGRADIDSPDREIESATSQPQSSHGYRWLAALLLLSLIGGGVLYWFQFDRRPGYDAISRNRAYAEVRILRGRRATLEDPNPRQSEEEFRTFKATMAQQVKSDYVLTAALQEPVIADLQLLQRVDPPIENLKERLEVDFLGEEFMRISLDAANSKEAAAIVNAVFESFLQNFDEPERRERQKRSKSLEDIRQALEGKLRTKRSAVRKLAKALESGDSELVPLREQLELERYAELGKHHAEIHVELILARIRLAIHEATGERNDTDSDRQETLAEQKRQQVPQTQQSLQKKVELLEIAAKRLEEEMDLQENIANRRSVPSIELETLKRQIEQMQSKVNQVSKEIQRMDIDIGMPRVRGYREATFRPEE